MFTIADQVELNSGGPVLMVTQGQGDRVIAQWENQGVVQEAEFLQACLKPTGANLFTGNTSAIQKRMPLIVHAFQAKQVWLDLEQVVVASFKPEGEQAFITTAPHLAILNMWGGEQPTLEDVQWTVLVYAMPKKALDELPEYDG
jgi:uncharacterized protein YodC (DUF2158 family)